MTLTDLVDSISNFAKWKHPQRMLLFGWFLHTFDSKPRFSQSDIRRCYETLNLEKPSSIGPFLTSLSDSKPKRLLSDSDGFFLPKHLRDEFDQLYGGRKATVAVHKLLTDLPTKLPNVAERVFLDEAMICFRHQAFRAAIVMTWNLTFDHLRQYTFARRLGDFNAQFPKVYPKKRLSVGVKAVEDFDEFKESEFLEICRGANIIDGNVYKILDEKLTRRNMAAHPSLITISQLQAEDYISDLVNNVVLKISL